MTIVRGATLEPHIRRSVEDECKDADHLGVVLVHGVGFQNRGETLLSWTDRLLRMLTSLYGTAQTIPPDLVHRSSIDLQGGEQSSIELRIPAGDKRRAQHWLVTEAYWAASFQPPSVPTMLAWLGARGAAALAARGFGPLKRLRNGVYLTGLVIGVLIVYAAVRVLTSVIPIAGVRNALVAPLDRLLTGWSGDMHVLLFEPAQSANIRARVREAMQAVAVAGFPRQAVIAHSGGAVASYMSLTDDALWAPDPAAKRTDRPPSVQSYITHGQGLNIAWRLCGVGDGGNCDLATGTGRHLVGDVRMHHPGLRWHDFYSEGDTVAEATVAPPACLADAGPATGDEHAIENKPSNPHGTYWDNDEQFLLPVVLRLVSVAKAAQTERERRVAFPSPHANWLGARLMRVGLFSLTSRILFGAMVTTIVASALFGGARMDDIGQAVVSVADDIPGNELITGPIGWLSQASRASWLDPLRGLGTYIVTVLLVLAALYPLVRLGPAKLAWESSRDRLMGNLVRVIDIGVAMLPIIPLVAWAVIAAPEPGPDIAPPWPVYLALATVVVILAGAILLFTGQDRDSPAMAGWKLSSDRSGIVAMVILAVVALLAFSTGVAMLGDTEYGGTSLGVAVIGAIGVWLVFSLLGRVANWRWDAWDEQEREQFRQAMAIDRPPAIRSRPFGRRFDLFVISLVGIGALVLAVVIGGPFLAPSTVPQLLAVVVAIVLLIGLVGAGQDAANSRAGVSPGEVTPLPTSAA